MAIKHLTSGRWHWGPDFAGYTVEVYEAGTSTQKTTYSDSDLTVANTWPVTLDANGSAQIWFDDDAKVIVKTPLGSVYQTDDEVNNIVGDWCGTAGGTADALTLTPSPAVSVYEAGQRFVFLASATNTGAVTVAVSGMTAKSITKNGSTALAAGDIPSGAIVTIIYDGSRFQVDSVKVHPSATSNIFTLMQYFTAGIGPHYLQNIGLTASVATKALTIALKTKALANASSSDPVQIAFRNATATTGDYVVRSATAATSVVVPSGGTLGFTAAEDGLIYIYAIDNAGTVELAVAKKALFDESLTHDTTAIGTGSDSDNVLYSTTARTGVAVRLIGRIRITTGAVAGEWDNAPTRIEPWTPAMKKTGDIVQAVRTQTGAAATGTATITLDDTIPQNTEGDEYMTLSITPTSALNTLNVDALWQGAHGAASYTITACIFRDSGADALACSSSSKGAASSLMSLAVGYSATAGSTSSTTFKVRAGAGSAGTTTFNGFGGVRKLGGVYSSFIEITEIQA